MVIHVYLVPQPPPQLPVILEPFRLSLRLILHDTQYNNFPITILQIPLSPTTTAPSSASIPLPAGIGLSSVALIKATIKYLFLLYLSVSTYVTRRRCRVHRPPGYIRKLIAYTQSYSRFYQNSYRDPINYFIVTEMTPFIYAVPMLQIAAVLHS